MSIIPDHSAEPTVSLPNPLRLIYHPNAGRGDSDLWLDDLRARLSTEHRIELEAIAFEEPADATESARAAAARGDSLVLASGGDGTLRAVAQGLAGSETALGILPRGTVNVLARELSIPLHDLDAALDICLNGVTRHLDMGDHGGGPFLLMCSAGFDAHAVASVNPDLKNLFGAPAYAVSALGTFATYAPPNMTLTIDGTVVFEARAFLVIAANAASYGGDLQLLPEAILDDGLLDVCVFAAPETATFLQATAFLTQLGAVTLARHADDPNVHFFRGRKIDLVTDPPVAAQIDGDACGETPLHIEIRPATLAVRTPKPAA